MPLSRAEFFKSDHINTLVGFDGSEHKTWLAWSRRHKAKFPFRVAFAINQHYPEFPSAFYRNKRLVALIQEAMLENRLHVVIEDNFSPEQVYPEEPPGSLEISDDYLLVDDRSVVQGRVNIRESLGGKSEFYHDCLIMEIITDQSLGERLVQTVAEKFKSRC